MQFVMIAPSLKPRVRVHMRHHRAEPMSHQASTGSRGRHSRPCIGCTVRRSYLCRRVAGAPGSAGSRPDRHEAVRAAEDAARGRGGAHALTHYPLVCRVFSSSSKRLLDRSIGFKQLGSGEARGNKTVAGASGDGFGYAVQAGVTSRIADSPGCSDRGTAGCPHPPAAESAALPTELLR
jgi:hypothetical protein